MRLAAALTSQEMNHSQLGREIGVTPQTAHRWLGILNATFQWFEVPAYAAAPVLGADTAAVLRELLGYDAARIAALAEAGVIGLG